VSGETRLVQGDAQLSELHLLDRSRSAGEQVEARGGLGEGDHVPNGLSPVQPLDDAVAMALSRGDELLALDEALDRLARVNDRYGRVVECRFYGGMSVEETAEALGTSPATVKRDWTMARAWLNRELGGG